MVLPQGYRSKEIIRNSVERPALLAQGYLLLDPLGMRQKSDASRRALRAVIEEGSYKTRGLRGKASTSEFTDAVMKEIRK